MSESKPPQFILASASPRRRDLLTRAGYVFEVVIADVDESAFSEEDYSASRLAEVLALAKARSVAARYPDRLVLGADTVVDSQGEIIGKPADAADAERITRKLFGSPHRVITGVAFVRMRDGLEIVRSDVTTVFPRPLTEQQIAQHIAGGGWQGKAGAYGIQDTGDAFVDRLDGSLTNVMGLPMELLQRLLDDPL
ncbi:MAG: septum formation protein Maf [Sedimentisphaerales bacterium]|nr:septum formation protein Maf [Sedimentisphaerales bacterium]